MKAITLIVAAACAVSLSSCCCQTQPMPKLRPMPKFKPVDTQVPGQAVGEPVKVLPDGKAK